MRSRFCDFAGFTLLEVIVTVVVLGIVGSSLMEEIRLQPFNHLYGSDSETSRNLFDDVDDYHNLSDSGAAGQDGVGIGGLEAFDVNVEVVSSSLAGITDALRITVNVAHPAIETISLQSNRVDYSP